jgi:hypothetical protein
MREGYLEHVQAMQPKIIPVALGPILIYSAMVASTIWNVYHDVQENPESSREEVYQKVALKLDMEPQTVKAVIENVDMFVDAIVRAGSVAKRAIVGSAKHLARVYRAIHQKNLPEEKLTEAIQKTEIEFERKQAAQTQEKPKQLSSPKRAPNSGGFISSFVTEKEEVYYRVYSGDKSKGWYLTKIPPKNAQLAREGLALPELNQAEYIQEVIVPKGVRLQRSRALPAFDKRGGMEQFEILYEEDFERITFKNARKLNE